MKYTITFFVFILLYVDANAQTSKQYIDSLARSVMADLQDSWSLGIDSNNDAVDVRVYNKFKNLFDTAAEITDDVNVFYRFNTLTKKAMYVTDTAAKNFELYAHDIALQVKSITIDIDSITTDFTNPTAITFTIRRKDTIQKTRQFVITDTKDFIDKMIASRHIEFDGRKDDSIMKRNFEQRLEANKDAAYKFTSERTLQVVIKYNDVDSSCKIIAIRSINKYPAIVCLNDDDEDGVLNQNDLMPQTPGDFTARGKPDYDFDGVPDITDKCDNIFGVLKNQGCPASYFSDGKEISGFLGLQQNSAKINLPELNDLGYRDKEGNNATDVLQSGKGTLQNPPRKSGVNIGGSYAYYFGKRKQTGVSVGFNYAGFKATYILTEPIVYTFKSFDGVNDYRRQITINNLTEEIAYNVFNFPVLFNYRLYADKNNKSVLSFKAGPSFLLFSNTSNYNATIDFGGLYQVDSITKNAIAYYDYYNPNSTWNIAVTSAGINNQNTNPGAAEVFSKLYNSSTVYDFASNKNYRDKANLSRITVGINVATDFKAQVSNGLEIKAGLYLLYAPLFERNEKYIPINKTSDTYNSIYNSNAKSTYSAFGITAGFVYEF